MISTSKNWRIMSLWIAIFVYFILTLSISLFYYWGYMSFAGDIGTFDQAIWGTLHGYPFHNTIIFNKTINYLGFHFRPILLIFLPFYALVPKVEWMILAQSFALSLTAWPIYLVAKQVTKSESAALFWALVYMVNPFVMGVPSWVFRPESLAVPFVAIALLAIEKSNFRLLLLACLFIVLCKEHFGIMVIGFGFLWGLRNREWKQSILLVSLGAMYSMLLLGVVMPALSPTGKHVMVSSEGLGQVSRYSWIGISHTDVFKTLLFHPIFVVKTVILEMGGASYLLMLLVTFLGFPLAAPEYLLAGLADLLANMMSANPMPRSIVAYHSVCLVPVLTVAAIYGCGRISRWTKKLSQKELAGFTLIASCIIGYYFAPLPLPGARNFWSPKKLLNWPDPNLPEIRFAVGDNSSISVQNNIAAYFSQRPEIYPYPNNFSEVDTIVLRLEIPATGNEAFRRHLGMELPEYIASIKYLLAHKEYGILLWNDPWLVFKRGRKGHGPYKQIEDKLNKLREEWKIKSKEPARQQPPTVR